MKRSERFVVFVNINVKDVEIVFAQAVSLTAGMGALITRSGSTPEVQ